MQKIQPFKKYIFIFVVAIIAITVVSIIIRYQVEGESNIPFQISRVMVISNAYAKENDNPEYKVDYNIAQNNDIYINIIKNPNYKEEDLINKVIIDNIKIKENPKKGEIIEYSPVSYQNKIYLDNEEFKINDKIEFLASEESTNMEKLQISNQGGTIFFRSTNQNLGNYTSSEDIEIKHDGTILSKIDVTNEELEYKISFDVSIELASNKKYKCSIELEMPKGNLIEDGITNYEKEGSNNFAFKRY